MNLFFKIKIVFGIQYLKSFFFSKNSILKRGQISMRTRQAGKMQRQLVRQIIQINRYTDIYLTD